MSVLHVTNGDIAGALIARAGIPGEISIWADPLHEGPVPGGISDAQLRTIRARFLAGTAVGAAYEDVLAGLEQRESALDPRGEYEEVVLWFEHDLFDQLILIQVLDRLGSARRPGPLDAATPTLPPAPASLICIDRFPGHPHFKGIGELAPADLIPLFEARAPVEARAFDLAARAWQAFRAADPSGIEELLRGDVTALPFLGPALERHLEEFPSTVNGLSRSETRLLQIAADAPIEIREAFGRMHEDETCFFITDSSFWDLARQLASLRPRILAIDVASGERDGLPAGTIAATFEGRALLDGFADRVALYGIDRWLGGVHLDKRSPMWRWDPARRRLVQRHDLAENGPR